MDAGYDDLRAEGWADHFWSANREALEMAASQAAKPPTKRSERARFREELVDKCVGILGGLQRLVYVSPIETWYWRRASLSAFEPVTKETVRGFITEVLEMMQDGRVATTRTDASEALHRLAGVTQSAGSIRADSISAIWSMRTGETLPYVPLANGFLEMDSSGGIELHEISDDVFYQFSLPFSWSEAVPEPPAKFKEWLDEALPSREDQYALTVALGALMMGHLHRLQCLVMLTGPAGTGKGTLIDLMGMLVGKQNYHSVSTPQDMANRFFGDAISGKLALFISDMPRRPAGSAAADYNQGLGLIKNLTGGDAVPIERKYKSARTEVVPIGVVAATNFLQGWARGAEDVTAWRRRILPFEFVNRPSEPIERYAEITFGDELEEIFGFLITRYGQARQWRGRKLTAQTLQQISPSVEALLDRLDDDVMGDWGEFVKAWMVPDSDSRAYVSDVKAAFQSASGRDKVAAHEWRALYSTVRARFGIDKQGKHGRQYFDGLRLLDSMEVEGDEPFG